MAVSGRIKTLAATPFALAWWAYVAARIRLARRKKARRKNSVVLISWDFPPNASTGVHLPVSFARYAAEAGWRVSVVCGPGPSKPTPAGIELVDGIPKDVHIHRVSRLISSEHRTHLWRALMPTMDGGFQNGLALAHVAIDALADDPPAVVVASGPRFCNFTAARMVAEAFGARLLLQYRDEWTINTPAFVITGTCDHREEPRCLAQADVVSFVSDGKRNLYRSAFPGIDSRKFIVTPNGWEPHTQEQAREGTSHLPTDKFTITYTGRCHVSFESFFECCRAFLSSQPALVKTFRIVIVGDQVPINNAAMDNFERDHPGVLIALPAVTPAEAIEIQRESSALLLINDYLYEGVIPLKTFEYLCRSQPVLAFGRTGGAARIVEETGAGLSVDTADTKGFEAAVLHFMSHASGWDTPARVAWRERHSRKILVGEMLSAIVDAQRDQETDPAERRGWKAEHPAQAASGE